MKKIILILLSLLFISNIFAQFTQKKSTLNTANNNKKMSMFQKFMDKNTEKQYEIRKKMSSTMRKLRQEKSFSLYATLLFISFLYGIFHSIGPGHGKVLISSSFLAGNPEILKGLLSGVLFAFTHSLSGLTLVGILKLLSLGVSSNSENFVQIAQKISFLILILLGIYLFIKAILNKTEHHQHDNKSLFASVLSIGLVPCPGSIIIALFSLRMKMFGFGILMILSMAVGMSVIISLVGVLTIIFKNSFLKLFEGNSFTYHRIIKTINILGSLFIIGFSLLFLIF